MVTVVVFEFGVMRCQPLRRALYANQILSIKKDLAWKKLRE
ncbi:TPA: acetyltransferase [Vibrio cholerae]|nr:acetyltransferase [Vibrio cholerae]